MEWSVNTALALSNRTCYVIPAFIQFTIFVISFFGPGAIQNKSDFSAPGLTVNFSFNFILWREQTLHDLKFLC